MRKFYSVILILSLIVAFKKPALADHLSGAEITYTCTTTPGVFEVTLVVYRDCSGIEFCSGGCGAACTKTLTVKGADPSCSGSSFGSFTVSLVNVRDVNPTPNCPSSKSICANSGCATPGTFTPGVERYEFKGLSSNIGPAGGLPATCCNVRFVYEECCRSAAISTGASWQNFYIDATINRCQSVSPCNSSPKFISDPYTFIYGGEPVAFNNGVIDPERDSISLEFTRALQGFGSSVIYNSPWAYNQPMPWTGNANAPFPAGIRCDPTGTVLFTPGNYPSYNFYGIVAIIAKQWKTINGIPTVVGTVTRDIQMTLLPNTSINHNPFLTSIPADSSNLQTDWEVCEGQQLCFDVVSRDQDTNASSLLSDTTYLQWDGNLALLGATFSPNYDSATRKINGPREDSYKFCWTPPSGTASNIPYLFEVKNSDSYCPVPGRGSRGFRITVKKIPAITLTKNLSACGKYTLGYNNPTPTNPVTVNWRIAKAPNDSTFTAGADTFGNISSTPALYFSTPGKYFIQLNMANSTCSQVIYDTLLVDTTTANSLFHNTTTLNIRCKGTNTGEIRTQGVGGTLPYLFRLGNTGAYSSDSIFENMPVGNYTVSIKDQKGCIVSFTRTLTEPTYITHAAQLKEATCKYSTNGEIRIQALAGGVPPYTFSMKNTGPFQTDSVFRNLSVGTYTVYIQDQNGCLALSFDKTIASASRLKGYQASQTPSTCLNSTDGAITIGAELGALPYQYRMSAQGTPSTNPIFANLVPGKYSIYITDSLSCTDSVIVYLGNKPQTTATLKGGGITCFKRNDAWLKVVPIQGKAPYLFSIDSGAFSTNDSFPHLSAKRYLIMIKDSNGCTISLGPTVYEKPLIVAGTITGNTTPSLNIAETYSIPYKTDLKYSWKTPKGTILSGQNTSTISVNWENSGISEMSVIVYSDSACGDTATLNVNINSTGIDESTKQFGLEVYPNPTNGLLNITLQKLPNQHTLRLYDVTGRLILEQELKQTQQVNLEDLPQGIYLLRVGDLPGKIIQR